MFERLGTRLTAMLKPLPLQSSLCEHTFKASCSHRGHVKIDWNTETNWNVILEHGNDLQYVDSMNVCTYVRTHR